MMDVGGTQVLYGMHPDHGCCPGETKQRNQEHCNHPPVDSAGFRAKEKIEHKDTPASITASLLQLSLTILVLHYSPVAGM